ncbi:unnamed protein product [Allacma fusca]|uniref:Uncharacterized protein n=1 Tax=Allacma fusca TaxID=39272 RepID=A0A8J2JU53_9HEXA|nr:unnamed protein product [Allacma fusca]
MDPVVTEYYPLSEIRLMAVRSYDSFHKNPPVTQMETGLISSYACIVTTGVTEGLVGVGDFIGIWEQRAVIYKKRRFLGSGGGSK